ncbi:MAG: AMP-binding protein, partial [Pseudomonadota bacterium]
MATASAAKAKKSIAASKPWLKSYPEGVPAEIPALEHANLGQFLKNCFREYGSRTAFSCMGKAITYSELDKASAAFAAYLLGLGLDKGDRVALMMPNVLQYPVAMAGVLRAGLTVVNVNPLYTPRELEHQLNDSGAKAIVILENFANTLEQVVAKTGVQHMIVTAMGDMMGLKGHIVNLVVRRVKKMVPTWNLPNHTKFKSTLSGGAFTAHEAGLEDVA